MKPFLVDTHCHVHFRPYDSDRALVLDRMEEKRIWGITIGTGLKNSEAGLHFADAHEGIWATVGLHPEHVTSDYEDENEGEKPEHSVTKEELIRVAKMSKKCVAIGETGLDWYRIDEGRDVKKARADQEKILMEHLAAAAELNLPAVFHCREALPRLAEILQGKNMRGVVHSFTGTWDEAKPLLDLGLHIAVNGIATFPPKKGSDPAKSIDRTIEKIPFDRLLLETDSPYLAPTAYRGKRNEPSYVEEVCNHVAKVRQASVKEVAEQTTKNAIELFGLHE
jgi:TatD DNase family protein